VINEELHSQKNYNIYTFESSSDKLKRIKATVVTQLISFSYSMLSFKISRERLKEIIVHFSNYYEIEENNIQEILKTVEDYCLIQHKKENSEIVEKKDKNSIQIETEASHEPEKKQKIESEESEKSDKEET
jgi:hypothetical protein